MNDDELIKMIAGALVGVGIWFTILIFNLIGVLKL